MFSLLKFKGLLQAGILTATVTATVFSANYTLTVDGSIIQSDVPHFWSRCVGTGAAPLLLREDWRTAARIGVEEAGFKAFRGHGILNASNPIRWNGSGTPTYDWTIFDQMYDFLVDSLGTIPVVELSFMPQDLQSGDYRNPPKNLDVWRDFIRELVSHCIDRYGREEVRTWLWEVWNEPDFIGFWGGTEDQYFQMYKYAAEGAKSADSLVIIGGPSTTNLFDNQVTRFLNFCKTNNVPVDMVTNHCYSDDGLIGGEAPSVDPDILRQDNRLRSEYIRNFGKKLLSVNSEYTTSYAGPGGKVGANTLSMDSHVNAPFVAKCIKLLLDDHSDGIAPAPDIFSYWEISDVFDEGNYYIENHNEIPFAQVFGLISYHGIRKATFNAFKLLHMMGTIRLPCTGGTIANDGVDGFATLNRDSSEVAVMVYNFYKELGGQTASDNVNLILKNLPISNGKVEMTHFRVDSLHSNVYGVWLKQGKPPVPTQEEWDAMRAASELAVLKKDTIEYSGGTYDESFSLPRQGLSLLMFKKVASTGVCSGNKPSNRSTVSFSGSKIINRGKELKLSLFSLDGKRIRVIKTASTLLDLRKIAGKKGICMVRIESGTFQTVKYVKID